MPGIVSSASNGEQILFGENADFSGSADPTKANGLLTNGQLWIGSTVANAGGTHINIGTITSPDSSLTIGYVGPNITAVVNTSVVPDLHTAKWIVNPTANSGGNQTTIQAAITAATSGDTIFVMPGTGPYTENLTLKAGVNIVAFTGDGITPNVTIIGKLTMTTAGTCMISNIRLQTNSDFLLAVTGSAASIVNLNNCYLNASNNTAISLTSSSGSSAINLMSCKGNVGTTGIGMWACSGAGGLSVSYCVFNNTGATLTSSTMSSGTHVIENSRIEFPITTSSTAILGARFTHFDTSSQNTTPLTVNGASAGTEIFNGCVFYSGTASALSIGSSGVSFSNCVIYSTHASTVITGTGRIFYSGLTFLYNSWVDVAAFDACIRSNDGVNVTAPSAYPYTVKMWDAVVAVDTASARTINLPPPSPAGNTQPGVQIIIKDAIGSAASNNITITPSGCQIDGSNSSKTINIAFGSYTFIWGGSFWFTV